MEMVTGMVMELATFERKCKIPRTATQSLVGGLGAP